MRIQITILALAAVGLSSCKRDTPLLEPEVHPDFYASALVNGVQTDVAAGDDSYYMHTDFDVNDGIAEMIGELKSSASTDLSWKFEFFSNTTDGSASIDSILSIGTKDLKGEVGYTPVPGYVKISPRINLNNSMAEVPQSYWWSFLEGASVGDLEPDFKYNEDNWNGEQLELDLYARVGGKVLRTRRGIDVDYPHEQAGFIVEKVSRGAYLFYLDPAYAAEVREVNVWHINNNWVQNGDSLLFRPHKETPFEMSVAAGFNHHSGATTFMVQKVFINYDNFDQPPLDFVYSYEQLQEEDSLQLNTLRISLMQSGKLYSTTLHNSPGNVTIEEVSDYLNDESGRSTKQIKVTGSFLLSDATGNEIRVEDADFVIAVATSEP